MNQALRRTIWITRAEPGAAATAERVRQLGHRPLVAPLLEVRPTAQAAPDLADVGALAFTSANAARIFAWAIWLAMIEDSTSTRPSAVRRTTAAAVSSQLVSRPRMVRSVIRLRLPGLSCSRQAVPSNIRR